jgi:hypothetical protein
MENIMADVTMEQQLRDEFIKATKECILIGYHPKIFIQMISDLGAVETAVRLTMSSTIPSGYETLRKKGRLDLSVEAIIAKKQYRQLFAPEVIARAIERLNQFGYTVSY